MDTFQRLQIVLNQQKCSSTNMNYGINYEYFLKRIDSVFRFLKNKKIA